jgi:hypothetical protein
MGSLPARRPEEKQKATGCYAKHTRGQGFRSTGNRKDDAVYGCTHITDIILLK